MASAPPAKADKAGAAEQAQTEEQAQTDEGTDRREPYPA